MTTEQRSNAGSLGCLGPLPHSPLTFAAVCDIGYKTEAQPARITANRAERPGILNGLESIALITNAKLNIHMEEP